MIDPAKLTAENGFTEGCVVEIVWKEYETEYRTWHENMALVSSEMKSIRPLTGPMAIWNFAPGWADIIHTSDQGRYRFFTKDQWDNWAVIMFDGEHDTKTERPFWARSEK